jgi:hypothetical protein
MYALAFSCAFYPHLMIPERCFDPLWQETIEGAARVEAISVNPVIYQNREI